ncbi:hypothetical protein Z043_121988, partial [Scleropages formosus]
MTMSRRKSSPAGCHPEQVARCQKEIVVECDAAMLAAEVACQFANIVKLINSRSNGFERRISDLKVEGNLTRGLSELVSLCCGSVAYNPLNEICCRSYVYPRQAHSGCCGKAYNSSDPMQKCCSGHLHKLSSVAGAAECCGTQAITDTSKQQCCISSQWELVYSSRPEFSCCGHQYYNTSEFFCCAGILHTGTGQNLKSCPLQAAHIKECSHLNLTYLCLQPQNATVKLGTLEATWQEDSCRHIVLTNVFTIYLREGRAELKASPLSFAMDHCSCPELDAGRQYLWIDRSGDAAMETFLKEFVDVRGHKDVRDELGFCNGQRQFQ